LSHSRGQYFGFYFIHSGKNFDVILFFFTFRGRADRSLEDRVAKRKMGLDTKVDRVV